MIGKLTYLYDTAWGKMVCCLFILLPQVRLVWEQETDFLIQGILNKLMVIFVFSAGWGIFLCFDYIFSKIAKVVRLVRGKKGIATVVQS